MKRFWSKSKLFKELLSALSPGKAVYTSGLTEVAAASVGAELQKELGEQMLFTVSSDREIHSFADYIKSFSSVQILTLPSDDPVQRVKAADILLKEKDLILIASFPALKEGLALPGDFHKKEKVFKRGEKMYSPLIEILSSTGYMRVQTVGEPGEYARRGQVIDFWPPYSDKPLRVVFRGDKVMDIKEFNSSDQRSGPKKERGRVVPFSSPENEGSIADYFKKNSIVFHTEDYQEFPPLPRGAKVLIQSAYKKADIKFSTSPFSYTSTFNAAISQVEALAEKDYRIFISSPSPSQAQSVIQTLKEEAGIEAEFFHSSLSEGFISEDLSAAILSPGDIFPSKKKVFHPEPPPSHPVEEFSDLNPEDYVVHRKFGIGIFKGIVKKSYSGMTSDFLKIEYASGGRLYVAVENADMVQKYVGSRWKTRLDSLSGKTWKKKTGKVRRSVEILAKKLIDVFKTRSRRGIAFPRHEELEKEFASNFPYKLTLHQREAVEETLKDMESDKAMDRLICGDVGFGKTEVAARAAFRAVINGYQVILVAPTTILARQHLATFEQRFSNFPVLIEHLSRLDSSSEQRIAVEKINSGKADIVIGTHRLFNKNIKFPSPGLIIVDEEQRFGVEQKEELRFRYKKVDLITTTATPIPRTLAMAMGRVKGFSLINTPPPGRQSVKTQVMPFDMDTIKEAVLKETSRGGQCYFVHNRVQGLGKIKDMLSKHVPGASFRYIHGRMSPASISLIMDDFRKGKFDVLVSTSIIENGLDLPNVNTMVINDAHRFGLSDIYQLRGRIGRRDMRAYCYLMYPRHMELTKKIKERLKALESFSSLGSGFQLALRDLQIRGAGELLGPRQHGNILKVGFDHYMEILKQEVAKAKGEEYIPPPEVEIHLPVSAYIPSDYIEDAPLRLAFYRKLSSVPGLNELKEIKEEMNDRFGPLPPRAKNLIEIINIKILASRSGVKQLSVRENKLVFKLVSGEKIEVESKGGDILKAAKKELKLKKFIPR
ncbi:MAG: transcription-repair coupling factor [Elusimicrobiota bacterium]